MAVTGLPDPQPDHAILMTNFALACRDVFAKLILELDLNLALRTGVHR